MFAATNNFKINSFSLAAIRMKKPFVGSMKNQNQFLDWKSKQSSTQNQVNKWLETFDWVLKMNLWFLSTGQGKSTCDQWSAILKRKITSAVKMDMEADTVEKVCECLKANGGVKNTHGPVWQKV